MKKKLIDIRKKLGDRTIGDKQIWIGKNYNRYRLINDIELLIEENEGEGK